MSASIRTTHAAIAAELDQAGFEHSYICKCCGHRYTTPAKEPWPNVCPACSSDYAGEQHAPPPSYPPGFIHLNVEPLHLLLHRVVAFQDKAFPAQTLAGKLNHLVKEAQELRDCHGMDPHEWADIFILLLGALALKGHTLDHLVRFAHDKLTINQSRQWPAQPDATGCYHHLKNQSSQ